MKENLRVLLSLMQLDIGGAETHVVELAKELKRRGMVPIVTSKGGAYEKELREAGIKHYCVPLQNKNPINMLKSVHRLKRIIRDEKIDVVHSHARIPSFILGRLYKRMKFPFVTTAHWVFTTRWGLKYITDWGEKTVAVSEDIKTYLMDNYGIPEGDIQVTINGIDTDKFSPETDKSEVMAELGLSESDTVIVHVSRLDESRSLVAKQLIEVVEETDKITENLKVVIVGDGDDFANVKRMADNVNNDLGRECIILTGARTDINKLVATADLFVGVSRAALEAMAAQKPVIIAGNEGYIGLFDEDKLQVGIDTNFCCRGCQESTPARLLGDIKEFFQKTDEVKDVLAKYGRDMVKLNYSVARMAEDTIKVYNWALEKKDEILISGYYGFKNSGDDALLKAVIKEIKSHKESPNITVLSATPKETARQYRVRAINRFNVFKLFSHMKRGDMLISGGGTLIQDSTSTKSLLYYLAVINLAVRKGVKVMLYANGIGPLRSKTNIRRAKKTLNKVDVITLREPESKKILDRIGVTKPEIQVSADPVFSLDEPNPARGKVILEQFGIRGGDKRIVCVSVRRTKDTNGEFEGIMARLCDYCAEKYSAQVVFIPMQFNKDEAISRAIMAKMTKPARIIDRRLGVEEIIDTVAACDGCIGMRLHSLIYATIGSVPLLAIAYDPKIRSFMEYAELPMCMELSGLDEKEGRQMIDSMFRDSDEISAKLKSSYEKLRTRAEDNGRIAVSLYEKGSV